MDESIIDPCAIEEWKVLQGAIQNQLKAVLRIRGWGFALITAIAFGYVGTRFEITQLQYLVLSLGVAVLFLWMELPHRVVQYLAIQRSIEVERMLRGEADYDGPRLSEALEQASNIRKNLKLSIQVVSNALIYLPFSILILVVILISFAR